MEPSKQDHCSVCWEILSDSETATKAIDTIDILKCLLISVNHKLLQELICEDCLKKVQSAYKFKILYSENSEKSLDNLIKEETNSENFMCEICKKILDPSDCVPFVDSESNRSTLIRHFSAEFESKVCENLRTCEKCHKSLLNFCTITNSLSIFEQNSVVINETDRGEKGNDTDNLYSSFKVDIKEECVFQDVKDEMDCTLQDAKKKSEDDSIYQEFVLKNEEVDLKCDVDSEDETYWKHETRFIAKISSLGNHLFELNKTNIDLIQNYPESTRKGSFQVKQTDSLVYKGIDKIENIFQCTNCDYRSKYKSNFNRHILVHSNDVGMFQCNVCNHQTKHKDNLKKHMLTHKNDDVGMFRCNVCNFQSKRKDGITNHMRTHKNDDDIEMVRCNVCKFQSKHKSSLRNHMRTHKNDGDFEIFHCNVCSYQTKHRSNLKQHTLTHKIGDDVKIFQCKICNYQLKRKYHLERHMLTHKNYGEVEIFRCNICQFQSKHKQALKNHMITHKTANETQMFQCYNCKFRTKRKGGLKQHMVTHKAVNEMQMFPCQICNFQTKHKSDLKRHMLVHKNDDDVEIVSIET